MKLGSVQSGRGVSNHCNLSVDGRTMMFKHNDEPESISTFRDEVLILDLGKCMQRYESMYAAVLTMSDEGPREIELRSLLFA